MRLHLPPVVSWPSCHPVAAGFTYTPVYVRLSEASPPLEVSCLRESSTGRLESGSTGACTRISLVGQKIQHLSAAAALKKKKNEAKLVGKKEKKTTKINGGASLCAE